MASNEPLSHDQLLDRLEELSRLAHDIEQQPADRDRQSALDVVARERLSILAALSTDGRRTRLRWFRRNRRPG
jgi:hypothetical protein